MAYTSPRGGGSPRRVLGKKPIRAQGRPTGSYKPATVRVSPAQAVSHARRGTGGVVTGNTGPAPGPRPQPYPVKRPPVQRVKGVLKDPHGVPEGPRNEGPRPGPRPKPQPHPRPRHEHPTPQPAPEPKPQPEPEPEPKPKPTGLTKRQSVDAVLARRKEKYGQTLTRAQGRIVAGRLAKADARGRAYNTTVKDNAGKADADYESDAAKAGRKRAAARAEGWKPTIPGVKAKGGAASKGGDGDKDKTKNKGGKGSHRHGSAYGGPQGDSSGGGGNDGGTGGRSGRTGGRTGHGNLGNGGTNGGRGGTGGGNGTGQSEPKWYRDLTPSQRRDIDRRFSSVSEKGRGDPHVTAAGRAYAKTLQARRAARHGTTGSIGSAGGLIGGAVRDVVNRARTGNQGRGEDASNRRVYPDYTQKPPGTGGGGSKGGDHAESGRSSGRSKAAAGPATSGTRKVHSAAWWAEQGRRRRANRNSTRTTGARSMS